MYQQKVHESELTHKNTTVNLQPRFDNISPYFIIR